MDRRKILTVLAGSRRGDFEVNLRQYRIEQNIRELLDAAKVSQKNNPVDLPVMGSAPSVSDSTSATIGSPQIFNASGAVSFPLVFRYSGGAQVISNSRSFFHAATGGVSGGNINGSGKYQNGYAIEWESHETAFDIRVYGAPKYRIIVYDADNPFGAYINKSWTTAGGTSTNDPCYIYVNFGGSRTLRRIRLEIGHDSGALPNQFVGVNVAATGRIWRPTGSEKSACVMSDSFGAGVDATNYSDGWVYKTAKRLGISRVQSSSLGGTGYIANGTTLTTFIQRINDIVLVPNTNLLINAGGYNDAAQTPAAIQAAVLALLQAERALLPDVPILTLGSWAGRTGPSAGIIATEGAISAAVTEFNDPYCKFIPVSVMSNVYIKPYINGTGKVGATTGDGNSDYATSSAGDPHPNDYGHDVISARLTQDIQVALRSMLLT